MARKKAKDLEALTATILAYLVQERLELELPTLYDPTMAFHELIDEPNLLAAISSIQAELTDMFGDLRRWQGEKAADKS